MPNRIEEDFLGKVEVPKDVYYGSFTARAAAVFKLSRMKVKKELVRSVILIKKAAALANAELGMLDKKSASAIVKAADEALAGKFDDQFVLDAFQAGAGTPTNMNVNEVLANRANELLGGKKGDYKFVHPNNHVNMAQSSNDVIPTAIRLAALAAVKKVHDNLRRLEKSLEKKAREHEKTVKAGRTHLQDAVPITYGQVFDAYAEAIKKDRQFMEHAFDSLLELGIGGTAVGTGINTHPGFRDKIIYTLSQLTKLNLRKARSSVEKTNNMNAFLQASSSLRSCAVTLNRIANDLRLLASGPKTGFAEIALPEIEPGSSIMPGKINPSVPEAVNMVCAQVIASDFAILQAASGGQMELNFMTPLIAHNLLQGITLLSNCCDMFEKHCIAGLKVDQRKCKEYIDKSFTYATALTPYLGYKEVSRLVLEAQKSNKSLRQIVLEKKLMDGKTLDKALAKALGPSER